MRVHLVVSLETWFPGVEESLFRDEGAWFSMFGTTRKFFVSFSSRVLWDPIGLVVSGFSLVMRLDETPIKRWPGNARCIGSETE